MALPDGIITSSASVYEDTGIGNPAPSIRSDGMGEWWYLPAETWGVVGDFTFTYDVFFPASASRDIANFAFWVNSPGATADGFMFRLDTGDDAYTFGKVTGGAHSAALSGVTNAVTPAIAPRGVWLRTVITATGTVVRAVTTRLDTDAVIRDATIDLAPHIDARWPTSGTFGQKQDGAGAAEGHRWDNLTLAGGPSWPAAVGSTTPSSYGTAQYGTSVYGLSAGVPLVNASPAVQFPADVVRGAVGVSVPLLAAPATVHTPDNVFIRSTTVHPPSVGFTAPTTNVGANLLAAPATVRSPATLATSLVATPLVTTSVSLFAPSRTSSNTVAVPQITTTPALLLPSAVPGTRSFTANLVTAPSSVHTPTGVARGAVSLSTLLVAAPATLQAPATLRGTVTAVAPTVAAPASVASPAVANRQLAATHFVTAQPTLQAPAVQPGVRSFTANLLAAPATPRTPSTTTTRTLVAQTLAASATLHAPTTAAGATTIGAQAVAAPATVVSPSMAVSGVSVGAQHLATTATLHGATVAPGAVSVTTDPVIATATLHPAGVGVGAVAAQVDLLAAPAALHEPATAAGSVNPVAQRIVTSTSVFSPAATAAYSLTVANHPAPSTLYAPQARSIVAAPLVAAPTTVLDPAAAATATVAVPVVAAAAAVLQPSVGTGGVTVAPQLLSAPSTLRTPASAPGAVTAAVDLLAAPATLRQHGAVPGGVAVAAQYLATATTFHAPSTTVGGVSIGVELLAAPATGLLPTTRPGPVSVTAEHLAAPTSLHTPATSVGAIVVNTPHVGAAATVASPGASAESVGSGFPLVQAGSIVRLPQTYATVEVPLLVTGGGEGFVEVFSEPFDVVGPVPATVAVTTSGDFYESTPKVSLIGERTWLWWRSVSGASVVLTTPVQATDVDVTMRVGDIGPTGGNHYGGPGVRINADGTGGFYVEVGASATAGVGSGYVRFRTPAETVTVSDFVGIGAVVYQTRIQALGSDVRAKVWIDGQPEPTEWTFTTTDISSTGTGVHAGGYTSSNRRLYFDDLVVSTLQSSGGPVHTPAAASQSLLVVDRLLTPSVVLDPGATTSTQVAALTVEAGATLHTPQMGSGVVGIQAPLLPTVTIVRHPAAAVGAAMPVALRVNAPAQVLDPGATTGGVSLAAQRLLAPATVRSPGLLPGPISVQASALATSSSVHTPAASVGAAIATVPLLAAPATLHGATVQAGGIALTVDLLTTTSVVHEAGVEATAAIDITVLSVSAEIHEPGLFSGAVTILVPHLQDGAEVFSPLTVRFYVRGPARGTTTGVRSMQAVPVGKVAQASMGRATPANPEPREMPPSDRPSRST